MVRAAICDWVEHMSSRNPIVKRRKLTTAITKRVRNQTAESAFVARFIHVEVMMLQ